MAMEILDLCSNRLEVCILIPEKLDLFFKLILIESKAKTLANSAISGST